MDVSPKTVLIHYHGGFLIVGDRYSYPPYWLLHACASREWTFVTPDYRLIPETTAHAALDDAVHAYEWVHSVLPGLLGCQVSSVLLASSSAGGYLALSTASVVAKKPEALLLIYGMLDPADYLTGISGLSQSIASRGIQAIPVECSLRAQKKLRAAGSDVLVEFPEDAEHGFDARIGNVNVEGLNGDGIPTVESLRRVICFLDSSIANGPKIS
ncbi:Ff.00g040700.m01.CDS01 [Fusarium sp. VM40]|nr:Ff.00g040700.m01.CDS01 [Fusarium sp. VM40]